MALRGLLRRIYENLKDFLLSEKGYITILFLISLIISLHLKHIDEIMIYRDIRYGDPRVLSNIHFNMWSFYGSFSPYDFVRRIFFSGLLYSLFMWLNVDIAWSQTVEFFIIILISLCIVYISSLKLLAITDKLFGSMNKGANNYQIRSYLAFLFSVFIILNPYTFEAFFPPTLYLLGYALLFAFITENLIIIWRDFEEYYSSKFIITNSFVLFFMFILTLMHTYL